jgi:hypothetical protein
MCYNIKSFILLKKFPGWPAIVYRADQWPVIPAAMPPAKCRTEIFHLSGSHLAGRIIFYDRRIIFLIFAEITLYSHKRIC